MTNAMAPVPASASDADEAARASSHPRIRRSRIGRLPVPTRRLAILVAALAPIWMVSDSDTGSRIALIVTALIVAAVMLDALTTPARWQVEIERTVPDRIGLGDTVDAAYVVTLAAGRPLRFSLYDDLPRGVRATSESGERRHAVRGGAPCSIPLQLTGAERGVWPLGGIVVRADGWLGLVRRTLRWQLSDTVTVVPSMAGVSRYRLLAVHHRLRDLGMRAIRRRGDGTAFASLREYVVGDEPRRVDWKATARRGVLISREYTIEQGQTVMLAIDAGRMMTQLEGDVPRFEYALSSAMLLADVATQSKDQVGALVFDDEIRAWAPPMRGKQALERVHRAIMPTMASMAEPDYAAAFRVLGERQRKRSLIVLFTDVIDARSSQALIAHTSRGAARHLLVVVALRNDRLIATARPETGASSTELYEAAAAEELVTARETALARMRHAGVSVLDVSPRAMTAAVINRYLELKARASL
ncbi:MAG TPA: DUF58 domain-containing protein [Gemmatimonadaceae bacterium]|nr:DUF58 domain-containing protein [Gemmatimonadaceae bacterium]